MIRLIQSTFYNEQKTLGELGRFIRKAKYLSFGMQCETFQSEFAAWQQREHCILVNSGSSANLAVIQALINLGRLKRGDLVGFSAITWSTNVMPLVQLGLQPIPIDVELNTLNISSRTLKAVLSEYRLRAVFLTNLLGFCGDLETVVAICNKKKIIVIEDNCESLGTVYKRRKLGNFGLASTFSFYVGHHMSTIEGGAVCTNDDELATMLHLVRAHGWDRNLTFSKQTEIRRKFKINSVFYSRYVFYDLGYNLRPTEITGFLGRLQLKHLDRIIQKRQENFLFFAKKLYTTKGNFFHISYDHLDLVSNFSVPLVCRTKKMRDKLIKQCDGVLEIRPIVGGDITKQPFFKKYSTLKFNRQVQNARLIHDRGFYFGNNPELTIRQKKRILDILLA